MKGVGDFDTSFVAIRSEGVFPHLEEPESPKAGNERVIRPSAMEDDKINSVTTSDPDTRKHTCQNQRHASQLAFPSAKELSHGQASVLGGDPVDFVFYARELISNSHADTITNASVQTQVLIAT